MINLGDVFNGVFHIFKQEQDSNKEKEKAQQQIRLQLKDLNEKEKAILKVMTMDNLTYSVKKELIDQLDVLNNKQNELLDLLD